MKISPNLGEEPTGWQRHLPLVTIRFGNDRRLPAEWCSWLALS